jgi:hypothetical protein
VGGRHPHDGVGEQVDELFIAWTAALLAAALVLLAAALVLLVRGDA